MSADKQELNRLISDLQKRMRLQDWEIRGSLGRLDTGTKGECTADEEWQAAQVRVSDEMPPSQWPHIVAHELTHILLHDFDVLIKKCLERMPEDAALPLADLLDSTEERICNQVAHALVGKDGDPYACFTPEDGVSYQNWVDFRLEEKHD